MTCDMDPHRLALSSNVEHKRNEGKWDVLLL